MKVTKITLNCTNLMNLFLDLVQKELDRLLFQINSPKILYIKTTDNSQIIVSNIEHSEICCPIKLIKTLKNTKSISLTHYAPNNLWYILSTCKVRIW